MRVSGRLCFRVLCVFIALGAGIFVHPANGQSPAVSEPGTLSAEIPRLAAEITEYMQKDAKKSELEVKEYVSAPELSASAGPGIQKLLIDELNKKGITHKRGARLTCEGEYTYLHEQRRVVIQTRILDSGIPKYTYQPIKTGITEVADIFTVTGASGTAVVNDTAKRTADVLAAVLEPKVNILGTQVSASAPQPTAAGIAPPPFAVELCRKNPQTGVYEPLGLANKQGDAYAQLAVSDVYGLQIHNRAAFPVGVAVTIDGLSMFAISEIPAYKQVGKLIVEPGKVHLIKGWHIRDEVAKAFEVTQLPESLVATLNGPAPLKNPEQMSTITVSFFAAAIGDGKLPPGEPEKRSLATKAGAAVQTTYKPVSAIFGDVREVVSIRYDRPSDLPPAAAGPVANR